MNNSNDDLISRREAIRIASGFCHPANVAKELAKLPSAQTELITKIQNGIKATVANDVYSCGMRNGMRWCISLIDDKEPLYENCPSAQPDLQPTCNQLATDCISRQAAIDALKMDISIIPFAKAREYVRAAIETIYNRLEELPSAQPDIVHCKDCEYGEQDEVGRWFCRSFGCQIGNEDGSGYCADAERRTDEPDK